VCGRGLYSKFPIALSQGAIVRPSRERPFLARALIGGSTHITPHPQDGDTHSLIGNPAALLSAPKAGQERGTWQRLMQLQSMPKKKRPTVDFTAKTANFTHMPCHTTARSLEIIRKMIPIIIGVLTNIYFSLSFSSKVASVVSVQK